MQTKTTLLLYKSRLFGQSERLKWTFRIWLPDKKKKKGKGRWSYDKMLIDWVRSGRTGKYFVENYEKRIVKTSKDCEYRVCKTKMICSFITCFLTLHFPTDFIESIIIFQQFANQRNSRTCSALVFGVFGWDSNSTGTSDDDWRERGIVWILF